MTEDRLKFLVNETIRISGDYEAAHSEEDKLHLRLIREFCPDWVVKEVERLSDADFPRYCA